MRVQRMSPPCCSALLIAAALLAIGHSLAAQEAQQPKTNDDPKPAKASVDLHGDPLPAGALARLGSVRFRHPAMITMLAVSPSGKEVITLCQQSSMLRRCDLETGKVSDVFDLGANFAAVPSSSSRRTSLVFADSGKRLVVVGPNYVQAIDLDKKASAWKTDLQQGFILCSAVSPAGKLLALLQTRDNGRLMILDIEAGKVVQDIARAGNSPTDVAFTHDGKTVSVSTHNQTEGLKSWSVETGKELPPFKEASNNALSLAYSLDGKWLALGHVNQAVTILDLKTKERTHTISGFASSIRWVDFTPDSKRLLAYDSTGTMTVLDPELGKELRKVSAGASQALPSLAPDSKTVVTSFGNVIDAWNIETGEPVHPFDGHRSYITQAAVSPAGQLAATVGQDNTLRLWDLPTGRQIYTQRRPTYGAVTVAFTPDGEQLLWASAPTTIEFLDVAVLTQKKQAATAVAREIRGNQFATFALSEDGKTLVANNNAGGGAQIWDLTQKNPNVTQIPPTFVAQGAPLAFSPDTRLSATMFSGDGTGRQVVIADVARGREITRLVTNAGQATVQGAFAGSRLFASRTMRQITLWDVLSGKTVVNIDIANAAANTTAITCSADGRLLAWAESVAQGGDRTIRLYDSLNGREVAKFAGHLGPVQCLRIHTLADRPLLLSGSQDSTALVWDLHGVMDELRRTTPRLSDRERDQIWADLGAEDAGAMHRASWVLAAAGEDAVPLLAERLQPVPTDPAIGGKIDRLVAQMDDDLFSVREQASQQAADFGEAAEPYLKEALKSTNSAEARHRIRRLLADIAGKPLALSADQQRAIRAVQILEQIGGPKSREVLERLTTGQPAARLTQEAKNALARLERNASQP